MKHGSELWSVPEGTDLRWRSWDGQYVVYHCASGDTHLLQPIAAAALKRLQKRPSTAEELTRGVKAEFGLAAEPGLASQIQQLVKRFNDLGLIERIDDSERTDAG
jgi:PqqD family protein of HPr-rel-A system